MVLLGIQKFMGVTEVYQNDDKAEIECAIVALLKKIKYIMSNSFLFLTSTFQFFIHIGQPFNMINQIISKGPKKSLEISFSNYS